MSSGSMQSNVGNRQVYNDGDQRTSIGATVSDAPRFEAGKENSHNNLDSKDERSLSNRLAAAEKDAEKEGEKSKTITDPLEPAQRHGNEPSRGAKIDAELKAEDEADLRNKGRA